MSEKVISMSLIINGEYWYTYKQLAKRLNVTHQTIYNRVKSGRIAKINVDGGTFYRVVYER